MTRIGMLTPSSNTCLEPVTYRLLTEERDVTAHFARVPVTRIALDGGSDAQFDPAPMVAAARQLADAAVDVLVWNGTSGSWLGVERDRTLCAALTEATGIPATTSTLALLGACAAYGVTRLGLAVPYTADVAERIVTTYAAEGLECVLAEPFGVSDNEAFARIPEAEVARQIEEAAAGSVHAVAVVCTNVYGAGAAAGLEEALGVPVFDSVAATLWQALDLAGAHPALGAHGDLLRSGSLRARFQQVLAELREAVGADRTTLRLDLPAHGLHVDLTAAEALGPGVRSIRRDASLDQRRLNTVEWLERHRVPLVQPRFAADPHPPQALIDVYGVHAQLLSPVVRDAEMTGWISAHSLAERDWSAADQAVMATAVDRVHHLLDTYGKAPAA
ncbi:aspartate/glutamate racemase family protein [Streptomyces sp. P9(2023)]|uniref:aspartate racemase/maleate isomerase family protein n=1 Tax=Streptomyces sp. P9(2023) TaxID=3064394 RepID=UPI0028F4407E|nr:GAF domain-containing protein [Streptomyces sp. P9(2023)]MDT9689027.1 aspartate/glutamate racemase family protein [Streptomyces sp. P9(2023)]